MLTSRLCGVGTRNRLPPLLTRDRSWFRSPHNRSILRKSNS